MRSWNMNQLSWLRKRYEMCHFTCFLSYEKLAFSFISCLEGNDIIFLTLVYFLQIAELNDEGNWRNGLRVRALLKHGVDVSQHCFLFSSLRRLLFSGRRISLAKNYTLCCTFMIIMPSKVMSCTFLSLD